MTSQPVLAPPPATSGDESDLITRIRSGDPAALSTAYRLYAADLLALGYRLTGSAADAEDVVQDLFVGLPEALERYRDRGRLRPWLRKITVRLALMRLRSGRRRGEVDLAAAGTSLAAPAGRSDDDAYLWHGLEQLPEDQRAIVVLRVVEGYSHEEIAELLGIRPGTSKVRLHRSLKRLRALLEAV